MPSAEYESVLLIERNEQNDAALFGRHRCFGAVLFQQLARERRLLFSQFAKMFLGKTQCTPEAILVQLGNEGSACYWVV